MKTADKSLSYRIILFILAVATLAVYWKCRDNDFTHFDDNIYVTDNSHVQEGFTSTSILWAFTNKHESNWFPLTWMSYMADGTISKAISDSDSASPSSLVCHTVNLLLHVANTLLLFILLNIITGFKWRSAFVAALFALHPLHVESVAWVAERKDVLSTLFWLLTMLAYVRYVKRPRVGSYMLVLGAFILGLVSKSMIITLPVILLLMDYWPLGRWTGLSDKKTVRKLIWEKIPLLGLGMAVGIVTFFMQKISGAVDQLSDLSIGVRLANASVSCMSYIQKMLWPVKLACFYPHPGATLSTWLVIVCTLLLAALTSIAIRAGRSRPYLLFGWFWYLITLIPVIGIVQVGQQGMADRYTYVPLVGLFVIIAWIVPDLLDMMPIDARIRTTAMAVLASLVLIPLTILTSSQINYWHDDIQLFSHAIKVTGPNSVAHYNLGVMLTLMQKRDEGLAEFQEAVRIDPKYAIAISNVGTILYLKGEITEAAEHFAKAVQLNPKIPDSQYMLGKCFLDMRNVDAALPHLLRAKQLRPDDQTYVSALETAEELRDAQARSKGP